MRSILVVPLVPFLLLAPAHADEVRLADGRVLVGSVETRGQTLRVLAGGGSVYGTAAQVLSLSAGTATAAVEALTGNGDIARTNDRLGVVDPLFADWITRRFPV